MLPFPGINNKVIQDFLKFVIVLVATHHMSHVTLKIKYHWKIATHFLQRIDN